MRHSALLVLALLACACIAPAHAQDSTWTEAQRSAWTTVNARWQAWLDDDLAAYRAIHHDRWRRWAIRTDALDDTAAIAPFWTRAKANERTVSHELTPVAVEIFGDGRVAAVHYVAQERVRRLRERTAPDGRVIPVGNETVIPIRFSDFLVKEGDRWLWVGGYRDGACSLFKGFGTICTNPAAPR